MHFWDTAFLFTILAYIEKKETQLSSMKFLGGNSSINPFILLRIPGF